MATERDFSNLPDVVWVNVMSRLTLVDRNRVSRTCSRLNAVFHHPSLWHTVQIILLGDLDESRLPKSRRSHGVIMPERYTAMIESFGAFFQNVELIILGYVREIKNPCAEVITQLAKNCRLESLTLEIGEPVNLASTRKPPSEADLKGIGLLISKAFRLKSLALISWPIYPNQKGFDILQCLMENEQIKDLEQLRLFERDAKPDTWFARNTSLPSPEQIQKTVTRFTRLTSLGLHADLLTESLMSELSNLRWLNHLSLLLIQSSSASLVHISSSSWKNFLATHPTLKVAATIGNTLQSYDFIQFFHPEVPLSFISFSKYSRYQSHIIEHTSACYQKTLSVFQDYGDGLTSGDLMVLSLATRCKNLNKFIYYGPLRDSTVLALAKLRGEEWEVFEVRLKSYSSPENDDEDEVIGVTPENDVYVKAHQPNTEFYYTDESVALRGTNIEMVVEKVSMLLKRKWVPLEAKGGET